jgi:predicted transcriptional regulator
LKCLSVSQPFANLIVQGKKTIELRKWNTNFRGEFFVHAPLKIRTKDCKRLKINEELVTGAIIGKVELIDVKKYNSKKEIISDKKFHFADKEFQNSIYGFLLKNPKFFRVPIPCKGKLGFFEIDVHQKKISKKEMISEIIDEEYRYQWINHH